MRFSAALTHFENGALIARARWNRNVEEGKKEALSFIFMNRTNEKFAVPEAMVNTGEFEDGEMTILQHPVKKNSANLLSIWLPTVEDMCAKDWYVVDLRKTDWNAVCGNFRHDHANRRDDSSATTA